MNPEQNPGTPSHNPYDFIVNPAKAPKKPVLPLPGGNNPFIKKLIVIIGGAVALMIILGVGANLIGGSKQTNTTQLVSLAQTQNELIRVATLGTATAVDQSTKNLAITAQLSLTTQQQQIVKFLADHGRTVKSKELALKQNAATDRQLTQAKQTSTFDMTFSQIMQDQLQAYASTIKQLFVTATSPSEKTLLDNDYVQVQLLLSQIPST